MEGESTLGELYDEIADKLAEARSRALMGERQQALGIFQGASLEFTRFREVLRDVPGFLALDHAFKTTRQSLCAEQDAAENQSTAAMQRPVETKNPRQRTKKAA